MRKHVTHALITFWKFLSRKIIELHSNLNTTVSINWASEASPTLGCSIEISRDILYVYMYICRYVSYVKLTA